MKKKKKIKWFSIISIITAVVLVVILIVTVPDKQRDRNFEEISYYFVYADKSTKEKVILSKQNTLKSLGGSGISYFFRNEYHLLANVYLSKDDASEIESGMSENFSNCGVITLKSKEPTIAKIRKFKQQLEVFEYFEFIYDFTQNFGEDELKFMAGSASETDVCKKVISKHLRLNEIISKLEKIEGFDVVAQNAKLCESYFKAFLDKFYDTTKKNALICEFYINIVFCRLQLFDNL